jgi:hypothetical protein
MEEGGVVEQLVTVEVQAATMAVRERLLGRWTLGMKNSSELQVAGGKGSKSSGGWSRGGTILRERSYSSK